MIGHPCRSSVLTFPAGCEAVIRDFRPGTASARWPRDFPRDSPGTPKSKTPLSETKEVKPNGADLYCRHY